MNIEEELEDREERPKFRDMALHPELHRALDKLGFSEPTPVQAAAIPDALQGRDIRACAQTGSGKTIAFVLPILHRLLTLNDHAKPGVLIVLPTRELGAQVDEVVRQISTFTHVKTALLLGGANINRQISALQAGPSIVVATPGRLMDHMERRTVSLRNIHTLVLDEADRMLDMGFLPDIRRIVHYLPPKRQTMLFSATFPPEIQALVAQFLNEPKIVDLAPSTPAANVTQMVYPISASQKEALLTAVLESANITSAIIFCRTKHGADRLTSSLKRSGRSVAVIHSDRSQSERNEALDGFKHRRYQLLVATDIASRGIDVKEISHVINYDVPHHPEDYVHRVGRTGRASATGDAFTLVAPDEEPYLKRIEKFINKTLPRGVIPNFPYLVPPRLVVKPKPMAEGFGKMRRRIPTGRSARFR